MCHDMKQVQKEFVICQQYNRRILYAKHVVFKAMRILSVLSVRTGQRKDDHTTKNAYLHGTIHMLLCLVTKSVFRPLQFDALAYSPARPSLKQALSSCTSRRRQLLEATETNTLAEFGQLCKKPTSY